MEHIMNSILGLGGLAAYVAIGLLAFGEAAAFIGLLLPGEIAVLLGGVLASQGRVSLPIMLGVAAVSAIAGDSAGYEIGRRWGPRLMTSRIGRRNAATIQQAHEYMVRRGGLMVFVGRWTTVLRAIVPGVAGMSRMPYKRFLVFNVIGGVAWAAAFTLAGYVAGESYARVEAATGWGSWILGGVLVVWIASRFAMRRRRTRTHGVLRPPSDDETTDPAHEEVLM
jgi:membrane-associated protein